MTRTILLTLALLSLAPAVQAQGLVEELPGGIERPVGQDWNPRGPIPARLLYGAYPNTKRGGTLPDAPPNPRPAPQSAGGPSSSQTIVMGSRGYGGGYGGGYRRNPPMGYPGYGPPLGGYRPAFRPHYGGVPRDRYGIPSYYSRGCGGGRGYRC
jgi:hypothetical protein